MQLLFVSWKPILSNCEQTSADLVFLCEAVADIGEGPGDPPPYFGKKRRNHRTGESCSVV